jgi:hypothetical protein
MDFLQRCREGGLRVRASAFNRTERVKCPRRTKRLHKKSLCGPRCGGSATFAQPPDSLEVGISVFLELQSGARCNVKMIKQPGDLFQADNASIKAGACQNALSEAARPLPSIGARNCHLRRFSSAMAHAPGLAAGPLGSNSPQVARRSGLVRTAGLEPARRCRLRILSPVCLPVPPRPRVGDDSKPDDPAYDGACR